MARTRKSTKTVAANPLELGSAVDVETTNLPAIIEGETNGEYAERISTPAPTEAEIARLDRHEHGDRRHRRPRQFPLAAGSWAC